MKGGIILSDIVGQIALELNLDSGKFRKSLKNLNKTADNAAKSMKSSFSGAFKKIAGAAAATFSAAAVIKFGKDCVESAASVNAANSQLSQTFGNLQGNAEAAMKRVADSSGIVQSRLQGVGTSIYAFANSLWSDCLKPIFDKLIAVITKLWNEIIYPLWEKLLKPLCDWIVKVLGPVFKTVFNVIGEVCKDCFSVIGGVIGGILDALGGLIDFISGVFTGDWEKAWKGISDFFKGIWDGIWSVIKFIINLIIDGINMLWSGIYYAVKGIVDSIGGISGALGSLFGQDWSFSMPAEPPLIPKLAKGGLATAPTLAMVGDNPNASSDPEVISPLSKLKGMIAETQQTTVCDERVIRMLQKIYDLLNSEETQYVNNTYLDSELIERKIVKVRKKKIGVMEVL
jgi:hypothetical protein